MPVEERVVAADAAEDMERDEDDTARVAMASSSLVLRMPLLLLLLFRLFLRFPLRMVPPPPLRR